MLGLCRWQSYTQSPHRCLSDLSDSSSKLLVLLLSCTPEPEAHQAGEEANEAVEASEQKDEEAAEDESKDSDEELVQL